ncbi:MAG: hypothetical protein LBC61_02785 [Candidatus Peribacteria bacterium]|nr:hypothetical protein [Candidatus Peribacteria bacterium]
MDNVDKMLEKEKKEIAKFVISYLRYLIANSLNLAKKDLENAKSIENPKETEVTKEEEKTETTISLLPDNELNQTLFLA